MEIKSEIKLIRKMIEYSKEEYEIALKESESDKSIFRFSPIGQYMKNGKIIELVEVFYYNV